MLKGEIQREISLQSKSHMKDLELAHGCSGPLHRRGLKTEDKLQGGASTWIVGLG